MNESGFWMRHVRPNFPGLIVRVDAHNPVGWPDCYFRLVDGSTGFIELKYHEEFVGSAGLTAEQRFWIRKLRGFVLLSMKSKVMLLPHTADLKPKKDIDEWITESIWTGRTVRWVELAKCLRTDK